MLQNEDRFIFYEFLKFFWIKKWFFITVVLIALTAILAFVFLEDEQFRGNSKVYTGGIEKDSLTKPELIQAQYEEKLGEQTAFSFSVSSPEKQVISFHLSGENKSKVEKKLKSIISDYEQNLSSQYQSRTQLFTEYINTLESKIDKLNQNLNVYQSRLKSGDFSSTEERVAVYELLLNDEKNLEMYTAQVHDLEKKLLVELEEPETLSMSFSTNVKDTLFIAVIGIVFTVFFTLGVLALWKYVAEARRKVH